MLIFGAFVLQIQVGVEFEASTRTQETTTSFGYQMELPEANMVFRGRYLSLHILEPHTKSPKDTDSKPVGAQSAGD